MDTGLCIEVLDPYEWLPGCGENAIEARTTKQGHLSINIEFEDKEGRECKKELLFLNVSSYYQAAFPGPYLLNLFTTEVSSTPLGSLVEYPKSEGALVWMEHYGDGRIVKHYRIAFLSENIQFVVFAEGFVLRDVVAQDG